MPQMNFDEMVAAAAKMALDRGRAAGDLNESDRVEWEGQIKTVDQLTTSGGYARIWFTDGTYRVIRAGYLFTLAD